METRVAIDTLTFLEPKRMPFGLGTDRKIVSTGERVKVSYIPEWQVYEVEVNKPDGRGSFFVHPVACDVSTRLVKMLAVPEKKASAR